MKLVVQSKMEQWSWVAPQQKYHSVVVASSSISCAGVVVIDSVTLLGNPVVTTGAIADEVVVVDDDSLTDEPVVETLCSSTLPFTVSVGYRNFGSSRTLQKSTFTAMYLQ